MHIRKTFRDILFKNILKVHCLCRRTIFLCDEETEAGAGDVYTVCVLCADKFIEFDIGLIGLGVLSPLHRVKGLCIEMV